MQDIEEMRKKLGFTNDFIFCTVMEENPDLCKRLVEEITGRPVEKIKIIQQQRTIRNYISSRDVRLDVYFEDDENTVYNVEMQATRRNDIKKRARYYQGKIDSKNTPRNGFFRDMKNTYIIFICTFDPIGKGLPVYTVKNHVVEDNNVEYEDGATKIFVNASKHCRPELLEKTSLDVQALISYCSRKEATSDLMRDIDSKVVKTLEDDKKVVQAMTFGQELEIQYNVGYDDGNKAGIKAGIVDGRNKKSIEDVDAFVSRYNIPLEEACETVGITIEDYNRIKEKN